MITWVAFIGNLLAVTLMSAHVELTSEILCGQYVQFDYRLIYMAYFTYGNTNFPYHM